MRSYDPNLRECMAEIEEVMKRHDCGGFVSLHSQTHGEFKMIIEAPSWSNVRLVKEGRALHIKLHMKSAKEKTEATVAMLAGMRDLCALAFDQADKIMKTIETHAKVEHLPIAGRITNEDRKET